MSSIQKSLLKGIWTQITTTDKSGGVLHLSGNGKVAYTESPIQPIGFDFNTPTSKTTNMGESFTYYSVGATDFVWAYAIDKDVTLTVTPTGD